MKKKPKAQKPSAASKRTSSSKASTNSTVSPSKWIRIDRPFPLPDYVREAVQRLGEAGHVAYVVGGCVRDFLLNLPIKDYDIATSAHPDELCRLFPDAIMVGKAFGVLKVPVKYLQGGPPTAAHGTLEKEQLDATLVEIATFREDLEYEDFRRPKGVVFSGPEEDARRRDFTINALFYDPKTARILDAVDGLPDLKAGVIRAIGDPAARFKEDALRLLRAVRFTTRFEFAIETGTADALRERAKLIQRVSAERVRDEMTAMLVGPRPDKALHLLSEFELLRHVLPELEALKNVKVGQPGTRQVDAWTNTLALMRNLAQQQPRRSGTLVWAALLHDIGKPEAKTEAEAAKMAAAIAERLKMSRSETERISALVADHSRIKDIFQMREATLQRFIREPYFEELLALHKADATTTDGNLAYHEFGASRLQELRNLPEAHDRKLITGQDLIQLGFQPGPRFSEILRAVEDLTLERTIQTKEEALEYIVKHFVS